MAQVIAAIEETRIDRASPTRRLRWALASLSLSMLMPSLDTSIANVALPAIGGSFGASFQAVQWIVLAYLLAITTLVVGAGRLGDIFGRKRLLLVGISLFTAASFLCGVAPSLWLLIVGRGVQGLGAAIMMALTMAVVAETVPPARAGSAMGLLGTMSAIGTTLGPSLGGFLIAALGWRLIFLVNIPLGILNFILALYTLPTDRLAVRADRTSFDIRGTLLLAGSLGLYALAMTIGHGRFGVQNAALLALAVVGMVLFAFTQRHAESPLVRLTMFRDSSLGAGLITSGLVATVMMTTLVVGPFYLSRALGLDAARVGVVVSVGPLVAALTGVLAGRAVDRFGARRIMLAGLLGMSVGLMGLAIMPVAFGVSGYIAAIVVVTTDYAIFQTANNTSLMANVQGDQRGVVSGMLGLSRNLGLITGASVMGAIFSYASSTDIATAPAAAVATGMRSTFMVAALLVGVALALAGRSQSNGRAPVGFRFNRKHARGN